MDLRLTITRTGGARSDDVTVTATAAHTASDLLHGLVDCLGVAGSGLTSGGRPIPPDRPVGIPPLLDGASLTIHGSGTVPSTPAAPRAALVLDVVSGPDCGHSLSLTPGRHVIGRDAGCSLDIADPSISRQHAVVEVSPDGVRVTDLGSTNPVRLLGGGALGRPLAPNDELQLGDTRLRARTSATRPLVTTAPGDGTLVLHRSPHVPGAPVGARLELPRRPVAPIPTRVQWLALLLPIPVCALLALLWGPQLLAFALLGPLVGGGSALAERRSGRRRYAAELADHAASRAAVVASAERALAADLAARHREHPDPAEVARTARERSQRLWERRATDPPVVRLGLGPVTSRVIVIDPDAAEPSTPEVLPDAPVSVDLSVTRVLGVAGPPPRSTAVARSLLSQLVTLHSPDDLVVRVVASDEQDDRDRSSDPGSSSWSWARWLPHARAGSGSDPIPGSAPAPGSARPPGSGLRPRAAADATASPWTVTVLALGPGAARDQGAAALRAAAVDERQVVIVVAEHREDLPAACSAVVELGPDPARTVLSLPGDDPRTGVVVDGVSGAWAERLARRLAPLRDTGGAVGVFPAEVTLATTHPDLAAGWAPAALAARWSEPPPGLQARLGVGADGLLVVDLVRDGPHALVGGTTGAGKSELLRALVTGLAAAYPPESVTFLLLDYKGGAAFRDCARLPHTVGVVTDLDADLARRALTSLTAEIRRREALLAAVGASNLDDHERLRGPGDERLPRLVIVVDEFKMLIEELPEFVEGVVRLAAIGRSLGVHLVLATQRPAGAITADIQANVNLRIALRVRDRQDSEGVIEAPDAALLPESVPGRALLSTGGGRLVAFQTTHVGSRPRDDEEPLRVRLGLDPVGETAAGPNRSPDEVSELALFVDLARVTAERDGHLMPRAPWLPALPLAVAVDALPRRPDPVVDRVALGLLDLPERQSQPVWEWSPTGPTTIGVVGASGSGRSTLVRTLVTGLGALDAPVHAYVVDGGGALGPLARLPWVGAVVPEADRLRLRRLVDRLREEVRRRTDDLTRRGLTTLPEWHQAAPADAPPSLLLVVDGWDAVAEASSGVGPDLESMALADDLRALIETGGAAGLRTVLTGGRGLLLGRGARLCAETVVLGRLDPTDAVLAGLPVRQTGSPEPVPGRGTRRSDGATVQVAHLGADPAGAAQSLVVAASARPARHGASGSSPHRPFTVGQLPPRVLVGDLPAGSPFLVGLDADGIPRGFDPDIDGRRLLVVGPRGSGRSSALRAVAERCAAAGRPVVLVTKDRPAGIAPCTLVDRFCMIGPDDHHALVAERRAHPDLVVLIDDADQLAGAAVEPALLEIVGLLDRDGGVVMAAVEPHGLARLVRGVAVEVASRRTGVLLAPTGIADGDALGVRVARASGPILPGRGHLVSRGGVTDIQLAVAEASTEPGPGSGHRPQPARDSGQGRSGGPARHAAASATSAVPPTTAAIPA